MFRIKTIWQRKTDWRWFDWRRVACMWAFVLLSQCWQSVEQGVAQDTSSERTRPQFTAEQIEFFEKEVRPLLVENCLDCHDPESGEMGGGLSLASRADLLAGGDSGPAIEPGDPINSLLIEAVRHSARLQMPPDGKLSIDDISVLVRWIELKAPWPAESDQRSATLETFDLESRRQTHWAWQPMQPYQPPTVIDHTWVLDPLDHFIRAGLEREQLSVAPPAEPTTWLRRVYFDLIGLPPSADELLAFQSKWNEAVRAAPDVALPVQAPEREPRVSPKVLALPAIQQLKQETVASLLAHPGFGERWARHWLDLVRYAETCGHEFDYPIPGAFEFRDYVIRSFNNDIPYNQFVREQIAGDLISQPRIDTRSGINESRLGTMFWFLGEAVHAPVDVLGDQAQRMDNQIDVFGKTFLGLTIACARCHDHKFDAISDEDYYALAGIIEGTRRDLAVIDAAGQEEQRWEQLKTSYETLSARLESRWEQLETSLESDDSPLQRRILSELAGSTGGEERLDPRWGPLEDDHPLRLLSSFIKRPEGQEVSRWWNDFRTRILQESQAFEGFRESSEPIATHGTEERSNWLDTGTSFRTAGLPWDLRRVEGAASAESSAAASETTVSTQPSPWVVVPSRPIDSGRWGAPLQGAMRSPTFRITAPQIHLRVRGNKGKIRLVIDGYHMNLFHDLLFSQTVHNVNQPDWTWITLRGDIQKYLGHQAYIEAVDEGDGHVAIDQIWMGGERPQLEPSRLLVGLCQALEGIDSDSQWGELLLAILQSARTGYVELPETSFPSSPTTRIRVGLRDSRAVQTWLVNWAATDRDANTAIMTTDPGSDDRVATITAQIEAANAIPPATRKGYVAVGSEGLDHELYIRGNHNNAGPVVPRGPLTALRDVGVFSSTRKMEPSGRLALAENVAAPDNPLTARVIVNRVWQHLMGEGLVATPDDFGVMGREPTHPELLDYLALEFIENGWSIKKLIERITLSQTYAMSTAAHPESLARDPGNRWLHHARVRRLEGEAIRDAMLQISGRLSEERFGPSVPTYLTPLMQGRGRPGPGPMDGHGRRSIYLEVRRNFLNPWMLVFDTPAPFSTMGRRTQSNVPAQSLTLLNDPLVHELAKSWAQRVLALPLSDEERLESMFMSALGRSIRPEEQEALLGFIQAEPTADQLHSSVGPNIPVDQNAAWTVVAHAIFNVKSFIYLE